MIPELKNPLTNGKVIGDNIDPKLYHETKGERGKDGFVMSRGELVTFKACPRKWLLGVEENDTDATEWGTLMDCRWLTPGDFATRFVVKPETYPDAKTCELKPWNGNSNWCKDWKDQHSSQVIISVEDIRNSDAALKRLNDDEKIRALLECSKRQVMVTAEYHDRETNIVVPVKTLIDLLPAKDSPFGKSLADFKTCRCASPRKWQRDVFDLNLHVQAALYLDAYVAATGEDRMDFLHVLSENVQPFEPARRLLSLEFIELGRAQYIKALRWYCLCLKANDWPGYDESTDNIDGWTIVQPEPWMIIT